jgi:hypothetical protein
MAGLGCIDAVSQQAETNEAYSSMSDAFRLVPAQWRWAVELVRDEDDGQSSAAGIIRGTAKVTSDGSFKDEAGTSASLAKGDDYSLALVSCNLVPGRASDQSAYRSELAGVVGSLILVWLTYVRHGITEGNVRLDGLTAL